MRDRFDRAERLALGGARGSRFAGHAVDHDDILFGGSFAADESAG
jgi:hypothetical protein